MPDPACDRFRSLLATLVDGELAAAERPELETHLTSCAACAQVRARLSRTNEVLKTARAPLPSPAEWTQLMATARAHRTAFNWRIVAAAALVAALLPVVLSFALDPVRPDCHCDVVAPRLDTGML